jgi:hypothetical protein
MATSEEQKQRSPLANLYDPLPQPFPWEGGEGVSRWRVGESKGCDPVGTLHTLSAPQKPGFGSSLAG